MLEEDSPYGWSFPSALLFTLSIITTIGYGHVAPKSQLGKVLVIVYSLVGLPLMLIFLANIGDLMAFGFRNAYYRGCCLLCRRRRNKMYTHNPDPPEESDLVSLHSMRYRKQDTFRVINVRARWKLAVRKVIQQRPVTPVSQTGSTEFEPPDIDVSYFNVPASLTITFLIIYLMLGALVFSLWEGWTVTEGVYFCFVTLSTIGFGDFVPTWAGLETVSDQMKLVVSTVYIVLGLAVLSMSLNLMMEEVISKVKRIAKLFGIGRKRRPVSGSTEIERSNTAVDELALDQKEKKMAF